MSMLPLLRQSPERYRRGDEDTETKVSLFPNSLYIFIFYKSTTSIYVEVCVNVRACVCAEGVMTFLFYKLPKWSTLSGTLLWVLSLFFHIHHISFLWQSRPHIIMDHHKPFSGSFFLSFFLLRNTQFSNSHNSPALPEVVVSKFQSCFTHPCSVFFPRANPKDKHLDRRAEDKGRTPQSRHLQLDKQLRGADGQL